MSDRQRADLLLVSSGLAPSREKAREMIKKGEVTYDGQPISKPAQLIAPNAALSVSSDLLRYVSRGGLKLAAAFEAFSALSAQSRICLDLGASTGGFCDVLLEQGAAKIYAVDVGHSQLAPKIARHPAIINLEQLNVRDITADIITDPIDLITADLSFISLKKALPAALDLAKTGADLISLIKPQFEAGRAHLAKGGIVKDPAVRAQVICDIQDWLMARGWQVKATLPSPIEGPDGNIESLIWATKTRN